MAIKHAFTSGLADGTDPAQVQPSNWNAAHTIDTPAALSGSSGILTGTDSAGLLTISGVATGSSRQVLRRNLANTTFEFVNPQLVLSSDFDFTAIAPGVALIIGSNSVALGQMVPAGVGIGSKLYLSGGTGTAEVVTVTGTSTNTIIITCANTHSGAYTIISATAGIAEAIATYPGREVRVPAGIHYMYTTLALNPDHSVTISGEGVDRSGVYGSQLNFSNLANGIHAITMTTSTVANFHVFRNIQLVGKGTAAAGDGFHLSNVVRVDFDHTAISGFNHGIYCTQCFEIYVRNNCAIEYNAGWGIILLEIANLIHIKDSIINFNSRSNGGGGVGIFATTTNTNTSILIESNGIEGTGEAAFTSVTTCIGLYVGGGDGLTIINNYFETTTAIAGGVMVFYGQNLSGPPYFYARGITEFGNWVNGGLVVYSAQTSNVRSFNNIFHGSAANRSFQATDLSTYDIGPDFSESSSPEPIGRRTLGSVYQASFTNTVQQALVSNYISSETGSNNAPAGALLDLSGVAVPLAAGLRIVVKLAHTLQAGANTFVLNGTSKAIKSGFNTANNIASAIASGSIVTLTYDGTQWQFLGL
jgi:hypothetical protein